ncbi:hypothetical protein [Halomonas salina]|uniref:Uncharacterized protein n=1 Tax=Halomonas salina TaxID=42565 RepID=A0ABR4WSG1_9GAMM|nr:hypothetical protein [Halomonas salina]KGE77669.1 hypothetical protein FP66_08570 [Halomonas salina]
MRTYSDAELEYYADRFMLLRLARYGINLEQYLANVLRYEMLALTNEPLLPAQQAAALRIWQRWDTGLGMGDQGNTPAIERGELIDLDELQAQWRADAEKAQRPLTHLPRRNGAIIEPLHHHRHPARSNAANFAKRGA